MVIWLAGDKYSEALYLVGIVEKGRRLRKERKRKREKTEQFFSKGSVCGSLTISLQFSCSKTQKGARLG